MKACKNLWADAMASFVCPTTIPKITLHAKELLQKINSIAEKNGESHYTAELLQRAVKDRERKEMEELDRERQEITEERMRKTKKMYAESRRTRKDNQIKMRNKMKEDFKTDLIILKHIKKNWPEQRPRIAIRQLSFNKKATSFLETGNTMKGTFSAPVTCH